MQNNSEDGGYRTLVPDDTGDFNVEVEDVVTPEEEPEGEEVELDSEESEGTTKELAPEPEEQEEPEEDEFAAASQRAQDRIRRLVEEKKALEAKVQNFEAEVPKAKEKELEMEERRLKAMSDHSNSQISSIAARLEKAIEGGDVAEQIKLNSELVDQKVSQSQIRAAQQWITAERKKLAANPEKDYAAKTQQAAPDERYNKFATRNSWWWNKDRRMTGTASIIHYELIAEGYNPVSDDGDYGGDAYYNEVERRMKAEFPEEFGKNRNSPKKTTKPKRRTNTPSRGSGTGSGKNSVKLTANQVAMAKKMGVPLKDYAKQALAVQRRRVAEGE